MTQLAPVTVLLSGGLDSATTVALYREQSAPVRGLFIDYDQPAIHSEWTAASAVAAHFSIEIDRQPIGFHLPVSDGEFFGRNALFAMIACAVCVARPLVVALGVHAGAPYYDSTRSFVSDMQQVLDGYSHGTVTLSAPLVDFHKPEVVSLAKRLGVPIQLTYSCERNSAPPCGTCPSCLDRRAFHVD